MQFCDKIDWQYIVKHHYVAHDQDEDLTSLKPSDSSLPLCVYSTVNYHTDHTQTDRQTETHGHTDRHRRVPCQCPWIPCHIHNDIHQGSWYTDHEHIDPRWLNTRLCLHTHSAYTQCTLSVHPLHSAACVVHCQLTHHYHHHRHHHHRRRRRLVSQLMTQASLQTMSMSCQHHAVNVCSTLSS